jgi:hypothetical protein
LTLDVPIHVRIEVSNYLTKIEESLKAILKKDDDENDVNLQRVILFSTSRRKTIFLGLEKIFLITMYLTSSRSESLL